MGVTSSDTRARESASINGGATDMNISNIELRHIVDVDGQLLGIDADVVDTATLLTRAKRPAESQLWLVRAGERIAIEARQAIRLSEDAVLFFETASADMRRWTEPQLLAA
jgi:hypothetical protein